MLRKLAARLRALAGGRDVGAETDAEICFHVEMQTRKNRLAGMSPAAARRAALVAFGGIEQTREATRDTRTLWLDSVWRDLLFGLRGLRRNPGFSAAVVLTLGLGVGANSAIFSVVNGLMLRPLPVRDGARLTMLAVSRGTAGRPVLMSRLDMEDYRAQADAFQDIAGYALDLAGLEADHRVERVALTYVSGNYFEMLGLQPAAGRLIGGAEGRAPGADPVLVLSHSCWSRRFNRDPGVVGKPARLNGRPYTIVGVAPEGFFGTYAFIDMDVFAPLGMMAGTFYSTSWSDRGARSLRVLGRLEPGVTLAQAQASLDVVARRLAAQYPETNKDVRARVFWETSARPDADNAVELPLVGGVFLSLVALILLVACVNVAGLLLIRGTVRARELALRQVLGAGRGRLVQQLMTESVLLSALGGAAGLLLGLWASRVLGSIRLPNDLPLRLDFGFDARVFAYVAAGVLSSALVAGLVPALRASSAIPADSLRGAGRAPAAGGGRHRLRDILVVTQVAASLVVLVVAGLFVRSLANARHVDLGFQPDRVMNFLMDPGQQGYDQARTAAFYRDLAARVRALPGVESASVAHSLPLGYYNAAARLETEGQTQESPDQGISSLYNMVDADYQRTMGIGLARGRWLTQADEDANRPVVVVNEYLARRLWPGQEPLGKRLGFRDSAGTLLEVVGVARIGKYGSIFEAPRPFLYLTHSRDYKSLRVLHVRTTGAPEAIAPAVRQVIRALAPDLPVFDVASMRAAVGGGNGLFLARLGACFATALGLLGLALTVVGLYGVVAFSAAQRTHEIGIRLALGARQGSILGMIVRQGVSLLAVGCAAGLALALAAARLVGSLLFDVSPLDPLTYAAVVSALALVTATACYLPARRATRVDPTMALRGE